VGNSDLDKLVHVIDRLYDVPNILGQRLRRGGNSVRVRIGNHPTSVNDTLIPDYPAGFYDKKYLETHSGFTELLSRSPNWSKDLSVPVSLNHELHITLLILCRRYIQRIWRSLVAPLQATVALPLLNESSYVKPSVYFSFLLLKCIIADVICIVFYLELSYAETKT